MNNPTRDELVAAAESIGMRFPAAPSEPIPVELVMATAGLICAARELLGHISDVLDDAAFESIATDKWNALSSAVAVAAQDAPVMVTPEMISAACPPGEFVDHYGMGEALQRALAAARKDQA